VETLVPLCVDFVAESRPDQRAAGFRSELDAEVDRDMRAAELEARTMVIGGFLRASEVSGSASDGGKTVRWGTRTADAERQLAELLDSWSQAEHAEGSEILGEATGPAAAVSTDPVVADLVVPFLTPTEVLDVLDRADPLNLDTILATLCEPSVGGRPAQILDAAPLAPLEEMLVTAKPVVSTDDDHRTVGSVLLHTVWPMAVIVAMMGVIFLWMG
jgi:hypothetical protein